MTLRKPVFEGLISSSSSSSSTAFEFDRRRLREVLERWRERRMEELGHRMEKVESSLRGFIEETDSILERFVLLDQMLATSSLMQKYSLVIPKIRGKSRGISFEKGMNLFLLKEEGEEVQKPKDNAKREETQQSSAVLPVNYSIGMIGPKAGVGTVTAKKEAASIQNVVMLTGANSGGKTTLLTTLASIHILSLYGLPGPVRKRRDLADPDIPLQA